MVVLPVSQRSIDETLPEYSSSSMRIKKQKIELMNRSKVQAKGLRDLQLILEEFDYSEE